MKLLKVVAAVGQVDEPNGDPAGAYIKSFEWGPENRGIAGLTGDPLEALQFDDAGKALDFWRQDRGLRPDGMPNRPLTAFTCEIVDLEGEL